VIGLSLTSRRLLLFPRGNEHQRASDYVAVYLDFPEAAFTPTHICPKAHFELVAINQNEPENSIKRGEYLLMELEPDVLSRGQPHIQRPGH